MYQTVFLSFSILGLLSFTSCSKNKTDENNTEAWYATYSIKNEGNQFVCEAKFQVGKGGDTKLLELASGDYVDCNGVVAVRADSSIGEVIYKAAMPLNSDLKITLHRKDEKDYVSVVGMPEAITLNNPTNGQILAKQQTFSLNWVTSSFSADRFRINLTYSEANSNPNESLTKYRTFIQDRETGAFGFPASETPGGPGAVSVASDIPANLQLTRFRVGTMPQGLQGQIVATRILSLGLVFR